MRRLLSACAAGPRGVPGAGVLGLGLHCPSLGMAVRGTGGCGVSGGVSESVSAQGLLKWSEAGEAAMRKGMEFFCWRCFP